MDQSNKGMMAAVIAVLLIVAGGVGIYALTQSDDETTETTTSESTNNQNNSESADVNDAADTQPNIVETAVNTPTLSTLVTAVTEANLVDTLSGEGPFTVLAPTDTAFANALEALDITAEQLLARDDLADILTYHVIAGDVMSTDLTDGMMVETVQGGMLEVDITDAGVFFVDANGGRAQVTTPDVATSNGTVHIINAVLLP